jgi:hypothetical protein
MDVNPGDVMFECKVYDLCEAELGSIAAWILPSLYTSNPLFTAAQRFENTIENVTKLQCA